jgi:anti-sigma B factor antagonist
MLNPAGPVHHSDDTGSGFTIIHHQLSDRMCVVAPAGEVDLSAAPSLKSSLLGLLDDGYCEFVLDLSAVTHMDSTGLGVLVGFHKRLPDDGLFAIAGARRNVLTVFELTGLDTRFEIFSTVDDALAHARDTSAASAEPALSADAAMVLGLASTAMPFADSARAEAERWLRILRLHGEAGHALTALGIGEAPLADADEPDGEESESSARPDGDVIATVSQQAVHVAAQRGSPTVGTADVLVAVMHVYGAQFDQVLKAHATNRDELIERLATNLSVRQDNPF